MNGYVFYYKEKLKVENIDTKINNLLKWGFVPEKTDFFLDPKNDFDDVSKFNDWILEGSFVSDYCPYQGDEMKNTKHEFTLKANLVNDSINLIGWYGEVWDSYKITKHETRFFDNFSFTTPLFDKLKVKSKILRIKKRRLFNLKNDNPKGVVYLLKGGGYTKIGISTRPLDRQKNIGTKLPFKPVVIRHYLFNKENLRQIESMLHNFFAKKRTNGEWFKLSDDDILFVDFLVSSHRMPKKFFEYQNNDKFLSYKNFKNKLSELKKQFESC